MSIINEALKKTGQFIQENEAKNNLPAKTIPWAPPFLVYILILLVGILLSKFIFGLFIEPKVRALPANTQNQTQIKTIEPASPVALATTPPAAPLEKNKAPEPNFVLNGIFFSDNDGYALVNNQIVRENDLVDGAKVAKITPNTVELENDGKLISLSTRR